MLNKPSRSILCAVILVLGIVLSLIVAKVSYDENRKLINVEFNEAAEDRYSALKREIDNDLAVLSSIRAFYYTSRKDVERSEFLKFTNYILEQHLTIQALEWIPRVRDSQREVYERAARSEGFPHFQFTEVVAQGKMKRAEKRQEYFPVYFVEPYKGNEIALGFDLGSNPKRKETLEAARKTGEPRATARIKLVQETGSQAGSLVFAPIYKKGALINSDQARWDNLQGFALAVFNIGSIVEKATNYLKPAGIDFFIYDESAPGEERFLYAHSSRTRKTPLLNQNHPETDFIIKKTLEVAGRKWMVIYSATPSFITSRSSLRPWGFLLGGVVFTGIVVCFIVIVFRSEDISVAYKYSRSIIEASLDPFVTINIDGKITDANSATEKVTGFHRDKLIGSDFSNYFTEPEIARICYQKVFSQGQIIDYPLAIRHSSGKVTYVLYNASTYRNTQGEVAGVFATARDITQRKQAEEALSSQNLKNKTLLRAASDGIVVCDIEGNIVEANDAFCRMLGYTPDEIKNLNIVQLDAQWSAGEIKERISNLMNKQEVFEAKNRRSDNQVIDVEINAVGVEIDGRRLLFSSSRDVTERKKLEGQLRQAQKMEAIGVLAGGVAHDFNNILTAIIGFGTLAQKRVRDDKKTKEFIEEILIGANRAAELTHGLLAYSRKQIISLKQLDFNDIVRQANKMLRRILREDIVLKVILANRTLPVLVDESQIVQVLLNLATNAGDAMPDGGYLVIQTEEINIDKAYAEEHFFVSPGNYSVLTVSDTGIGMDLKTTESIFEPFFTTKGVGKGTGLGLAMVYGTIKQHNGYITVYSDVGKGTTFRIYLPLAQTEEAVSKPIETLIRGKGETILVAEDDPHVRKITVMSLQENGYTVIEAENGEEAAKRFVENKDTIAILLFDVIMPLKNGREAYEEIKKLDPDIKAIFMSGYTDDAISRKGILEEGVDFISKPLNPATLMRKIREVLDR